MAIFVNKGVRAVLGSWAPPTWTLRPDISETVHFVLRIKLSQKMCHESGNLCAKFKVSILIYSDETRKTYFRLVYGLKWASLAKWAYDQIFGQALMERNRWFIAVNASHTCTRRNRA